jgi:hypothetical protein
MKFNQYWLVAFGIAFAAMFPNLAHSKPVDPIGDIIGQRMGWDAPAPKRTPPKPKPTTVRPASAPQAASLDVRSDAAEAEDTARDFQFTLAFSR